jgi:hypothetical protein
MKFKLIKKDDKFMECKLIDWDNTQFNLLDYVNSVIIEADPYKCRLTLELLSDDIDISGDEIHLKIGDDTYEVIAVKVKE